MLSTNLVLSVTALTAAGVAYAQNAIVVATATVAITQCQPYLIKWTGGSAPFFPVVTVAGMPSSVLKAFPQTNENQVLWNPVNQAAGTSVTFAVTDSTGVQYASAPSIPIISSADSSCVGKDSTSSSVSSAASSAASSASSTSVAPSSSAPSSSAPSSSAPSSTPPKSSTSSAPTTTATSTPPNAASNVRGYSAVVAAVVGVAVAALL